MATYYVHGQTGSDANSGLTSALAKQSLSGLVGTIVTGDTVNFAERIYDNATFGSFSNVTFQQEVGQTQCVFDGSSPQAQSGWTAVTNGWYKDIGTSLGIEYCIYGTATNSRGSFTRHLTSDSAANVAAATGATGKYNYNSVSGRLTVYLGGDNPNSSGKTVAYIARNGQNTIYTTTGDSNTYKNLWFENWQNNGQSGCLYLENQTNLRIEGCRSWDSGYHSFIALGQVTALANCTMVNCYSYGCVANGSHMTYYNTNAAGNTSALRFINCWVERHVYLNIDGTPCSGLSNSQTAYLCHADAGTPCRDVEAVGCYVYDQDVANAPAIEWQSMPAPTSETTWSGYYCRSQNCTLENQSRLQMSNPQAMRANILNFQQSGSSGLCRYNGFGCIAMNATLPKLLMEGCAIRFRSNDGANSPVNIEMLVNANARYYFYNCSIIDDGTNASSGMNMFYFTTGTTDTMQIHVKGCILGYATTTGGTQALVYAEGSTAAAFILDDNVYGLFQNYGAAGTVAIANAAALAAKDTHSKILSTNPFNNYATNLRLLPGSSAYGYKRLTFSPTPSETLDGNYAGFPGAYQGSQSARSPRSASRVKRTVR